MNIVSQNNANGISYYNNTVYQKKNYYLKFLLYTLIGMLLLLIVLIVIFSINKKEISTRTFMIYMVGADLESKNLMGTYELEGINPSLVDFENVNVVLIAGGALKWGNNYIDKDETSIYQLTRDGFIKVKQQAIKNMGDSQTLSDFINFTSENYITDEYELLFWNHGGAILGSEFDELSDDNLSLLDISQALSETPFNKKNRIETIVFSTCLNGTIENANIFKDFADYFVASEEISMSYANASDFSFINDVTSETKSLDIGRMFINKYKEKMAYLKSNYEIHNQEYDIYSTYSLIDLNNLDNLNDAVNNFFEQVDVLNNYKTIAKVRSNLYQYAYLLAGDPNYDTVDLYNLVLNLKQLSPKAADIILKELENTIIYNYATNPSSRGISIYFPYNGTTSIQNMFLNMYDDISDIKNYNNFISEFNSLMTKNALSNKLSFKDNISTVDSQGSEDDFELELTQDQVENFAKGQYLVFRDNKDGTYLPVYKGTETILDGNSLKAKIKDRQLKIKSISDGEENILTLFEEEVGDTYIKYSTIVTLENFSSENVADWKMDTAKMYLLLDKATKKIVISEVLLSAKNDLPSRVLVNLNDYTHVIFASSSYIIANSDGTYNENWESNGIIKGIEVDVGDFEFSLQEYDGDYDYYSVFRIFDVNNNSYYSKLVKMK